MQSIFQKLFSMFSDATALLSLEAEELAGPLLLSLEDNNRIVRENVISYDLLSKLFDSMPNMRQKYPTSRDNEILFALMEAWQWLEREGFIAPRPTSLAGEWTAGTIDKYFVTRRGKRIKSREDFEAYRKGNLLPERQLHPIIAQKVRSLFLRGDYDSAIFQSFKEVEIAVRNAGNYDQMEIGANLMRKAFNVSSGKLTDHTQPASEKQALSDLFAGAIGYYKNPHSHRNVPVTAEETVEMIILASHLLRIVDLRKQP